MKALTMIELCRECAATVYGTRAPSPRYADAVARLLMGTAAAESLLIHRRQLGFSMSRLDGAWGLWQTESAAVMDNVRYLRRREDVAGRAAQFLRVDDARMAATLRTGEAGLMRQIYDDDRLACLMARVHYLRVSSAVPDDLRGQAGYWKRYYNTRLGKGTVGGYIEKYMNLIEPWIFEPMRGAQL